MSFNIWEGIYKNFTECSSCGDGFSSERWVEQETERINKLKADIKKSPAAAVGYRTSLLPFLIALVAGNLKEKKVNVLDFGGGLGATYLLITSGCVKQGDINFSIVESERICRRGIELFKNDSNISFHNRLPENIKGFDVIHLGSSIQYVENWRGLMRDLTQYNPVYVLLADVPAGKIPTYATVQNYYGSKIPYWFFNINDIIDVMNAINYTLLFQSVFIDERLGMEQPIPQDNFPKEYRVGDTCNLLFIRENK